MKKISKLLKQQAIDLNMCQEGIDLWKNQDKGELVEMYIRYIDFAIKHNWPSCGLMKKHFDGTMQRYGVFVDDKLNELNPRQCVCNGSTSGVVQYNDFATGAMYIRHDSDVTVEVSGSARVSIELYDNARVKVVNTGTVAVRIFKYSGSVVVEGNVIVKERSTIFSSSDFGAL